MDVDAVPHLRGKYIYMTRTPPKQSHFMYQPLSGKPWTRVKRPLYTDQIILRFRLQAGPKELFAPKEIRTLDLMGLPQRPKPLSLEPMPWGYKKIFISCIH